MRVLSNYPGYCVQRALSESQSFGVDCKLGGKLHPTLNTCWELLDHKYHEGKVIRTLERELNVPEIGEGISV